LGPLHGESQKHSYAPVAVTKWTRRREKLLEELRGIDADILCLQEVSGKSLKETFIPGLKRVDLDCCGFAPGKSIHNAKGSYAHKAIGCATFFKTSKFNVLHSKRVHLRDYIPLQKCQSQSFQNDVSSHWHSMAMTLIQVKNTNQTFMIANTHLYWNPARPDIKAVQTWAIINAITRFGLDIGLDSNPPLIVCGDFNTTPDLGMTGGEDPFSPSAPFEILSNGALDGNHPQHPDRWYPTLDSRYSNPRLGRLEIPYKLTHAYSIEEFKDQQPLFTTKTDNYQGWIDHIWVNDHIDVSMVLSPTIRSGDLEANLKAREFKPIPDKNHPSDHLPIGIVANIKS